MPNKKDYKDLPVKFRVDKEKLYHEIITGGESPPENRDNVDLETYYKELSAYNDNNAPKHNFDIKAARESEALKRKDTSPEGIKADRNQGRGGRA